MVSFINSFRVTLVKPVVSATITAITNTIALDIESATNIWPTR